MVKKLIKHEFIYYIRTLGIALPIVLFIGVMTRVFRFFDNGHIVTDIIIGSSALVLFVACISLIVLSGVAGVVRFYKNMYSSEGYLTFTLPVTNAQHIFVKLLVATVCQTACIWTVIAAGSIALSGRELGEVLGFIAGLIDGLFVACGAANSIGFILEVVLLLILSAVSSFLLYYACITVGQTAKKNRIFAAVGAYFVCYVATQVISTAFVIIFTILATAGALDGVAMWFANNMVAGMHIVFGVMIVISAAVTAALWLVTQNIMSKKLNLE